jgi:HK97 family phage prohead protease
VNETRISPIIETVKARDINIGGQEQKSFGLSDLKAAGDTPGEFTALVSVFGNVDSGADRVMPGAFTKTLAERGLPPIVWSHDQYVPPIGTCLDAKETDEGLLIHGRLFVSEQDDHEIARQVYTAMKTLDGRGKPTLRDFSFGYRVVKARWTEERDNPDLPSWTDQVRELLEVELFECGPCLVGMNPHAGLTGTVKSQISQHTPATPQPAPATGKTPTTHNRQHAAHLARLLTSHTTT